MKYGHQQKSKDNNYRNNTRWQGDGLRILNQSLEQYSYHGNLFIDSVRIYFNTGNNY